MKTKRSLPVLTIIFLCNCSPQSEPSTIEFDSNPNLVERRIELVDASKDADIIKEHMSIDLVHDGNSYPHGTRYDISNDNSHGRGPYRSTFVFQKKKMAIQNISNMNVVVHQIRIIEKEGVQDEEWQLFDITHEGEHLLELQDVNIAPGNKFEFYLGCQPVFGGARNADLEIDYSDENGVHEYVVSTTCSCSGSNLPADDFTLITHKLLGSVITDELVTGMVVDEQGSSYFLLHTKNIPGYDGSFYDLVIVKVSPNGDLLWNKIYSRIDAWEWCPDSGGDNKNGGVPGAIVLDKDGFLYFVGNMSETSSGHSGSIHIIKLDAIDGNIIWDVLWRPRWPNVSSASGYALTTKGDRVFITGGTSHEASSGMTTVLFLAIDKLDGHQIFAKAINISAGSSTNGYAIAVNPENGQLFIGGGSSSGFLMKWDHADTDNPILSWAESIEKPINFISIDENDVYLSFTSDTIANEFNMARVNGADGSVIWAKKTINGGDINDHCSMLKVYGEWVYAVGSNVLSMDEMGRGVVIRLDKTNGTSNWGGYYYTGNGPNQMTNYQIKSISMVEDVLYLAGQVQTGQFGDENYRYDGYWYKYRPSLDDMLFFDPYRFDSVDVFDFDHDNIRQTIEQYDNISYDDLFIGMPWVDASDKRNGDIADSDLFWMKLKLH